MRILVAAILLMVLAAPIWAQPSTPGAAGAVKVSPAPTPTNTPTPIEIKRNLENESAAIDAEIERLQGLIDEALKQIGSLALRKKALEKAIIGIRVPERKATK